MAHADLGDFDTISDEGVPQYSPIESVTRNSQFEKRPRPTIDPTIHNRSLSGSQGSGRVDQWRQAVPQSPGPGPSRAASIRSYASSSQSGSQRRNDATSAGRAHLSEVEEAQRQFQLAQQQLLLAAQRLALAGASQAPPAASPFLDTSLPPLGTSPHSDREYLTPVESLPSPVDSPIEARTPSEVPSTNAQPVFDFDDARLDTRPFRGSPLSSSPLPRSSSSLPTTFASTSRSDDAFQRGSVRSSPSGFDATSRPHVPANRSTSKQTMREEELAAAAQCIERAETAPPPSYSALPPSPPTQTASPITPSTSTSSSSSSQSPFAHLRFQAPIASPVDYDPMRARSPAATSEISVQEFHGFRPRVNSIGSQQALNTVPYRPILHPASRVTATAAYQQPPAGVVPSSAPYWQASTYSTHGPGYAQPAVPVVPYSRHAPVTTLPPPGPRIVTAFSPTTPHGTTAPFSPSVPLVSPGPNLMSTHQPFSGLLDVGEDSPSAAHVATTQDAQHATSREPSPTPTSFSTSTTTMLKSRVRSLRERVMSPHVRFKSPSPEDDEAVRSLVEGRIEAQRGSKSLANVERSLSMLL